LLGLRWDDVELNTGTLAVRRARVAAGYDVFEGETKNGRARLVRIPEGAVAALRRHRRAQLGERLAWGACWADSGYLFTCEDGQPLHPHSLTDSFERRVRAIEGVPVIRFHDLRHTCATLLLQAEVHPKVVQEMLGHSSIAITLDIYSHVVPSMQEEAAARLHAAVFASSV
jgi:integrase